MLRHDAYRRETCCPGDCRVSTGHPTSFPGVSVFSLVRAATMGVIAMVATAGCKGPELFGPGDDESLPENHPPAVGPARTGFTLPTWSQNGHLAYVLPDFLTAVSRADG